MCAKLRSAVCTAAKAAGDCTEDLVTGAQSKLVLMSATSEPKARVFLDALEPLLGAGPESGGAGYLRRVRLRTLERIANLGEPQRLARSVRVQLAVA